MVVWDVFPYWREIQFLGARKRLWDRFAPEIDYRMVACVGNRTHRGTPLPAPLDPAVALSVTHVHHVILDADSDWGREHQQRDSAKVALQLAGAEPDDMVLLCDADELVDPRQIEELEFRTRFAPVKLGMDLFYYGTRWRAWNQWNHAVACRVSHVGDHPSTELRTSFTYTFFRSAGWHISYVGGDEAIDQKLSSFAHSEFDTPEHRVQFKTRQEQGLDPHNGQLQDMPLDPNIASIIFP